jgi:hypothetical protein
MNARTKAIALLIFFSFVLAHLFIPHHHHLPDNFHATLEHAHHHDADTDEHHGEHNAYTFTQADHSFVNAKSVVVMAFICFLILTLTFICGVEVNTIRSYFDCAIERPPLLYISAVSFRGPPIQ